MCYLRVKNCVRITYGEVKIDHILLQIIIRFRVQFGIKLHE